MSQSSLYAALAAVLLSPLGAHAAEEIATNTEVDKVEITARSLEETLPLELARYGSDVAIITAEQVKNGGFVDTVQALQTLTPGLYIAPGAGPFSYVDLSLQGSRTQDVLWTVDGVRINNRLYNSTTPVDTLPASMIERIEVLKGGQGLFYGTQAAAGVINVVTRAFSNETGGELTIGGDTNDTFHADGYLRGALGRHKYVLYASKDESDGITPYDLIQPSATDRKRGFDVVTLGLKYGFDFTDDLRFTASWQHTNAKLDNLSPRLVRTSYNDRDEEIVSARLDYTPSDQAQFFVKGYFHDWDTTYENVQNGASGPVVVYPAGTYWGYQDYGVSAQAKLRPHKGLEYQLGYDFQNFKGRDEVLLIDGKTEKVHALIAQVRTTEDLIDNGVLTFGVRYNHGQGSDTTIWTLSGRYDLTPQLYVEGVGGTSFLLPDAEQLFGVDPCCARGNPDLKAEKSRNVNLAIGGDVSAARLGWKLTGFSRRIDNLIADDYANPAYPDGLYINVDGTVRVDGVEAAGQAQLGAGFSLNASYTYTKSRNAGSALQRDRTPRDFAKASLSYAPTGKPYGADLSVNWTGDVWQTVSGFGRVNYGGFVVADIAAHVFLDAERHHRLGLRVQNLFDEDYAARLGSAPRDGSTSRFLYRNLGVPRTAHVRYSYAF